MSLSAPNTNQRGKAKGLKSWIVDRLENGAAVLVSGQEQVIVPRLQLPEKVKEGDELTAEFYHLKDAAKRRESIARALLEEILGS